MVSTDSSFEDATPDPNSLELGLAAIKQKQYQQAIALLAPIAESQPSTKAALKAQIGLIKAYVGSGQSDRAISLCQTLTNSPHPKIRTWVSKTLNQIQNNQPEPSPPVPAATGFVPLDPTLQPPKVKSTTPKPKSPPAPEPPQTNPKIDLTPPPEPQLTPPTVPTPQKTQPRPWQQAERATQWRRMGKLKLTRFRIEQFITVFILLWLSPQIIEFIFQNINRFLRFLPYVKSIQWLYRDPTLWFYGILGLLFISCPWLLDGLLKLCYGQKTLPRTKLLELSPEASRILKTYCQKQKWKFPALRVLPTATPIAMTYGCWPRFVRIVVSQGLIDTLTADEIATIYAREIASVGNWDFLAMSFITLLLQIPYFIYQQSAMVGEWLFNGVRQKPLPRFIPDFLLPILKPITKVLWVIACPVSVFGYGIYQFLRFPALWISRRRVYYSDRISSNLTGNPNGLTRALLKIAIGISETIPKDSNITFLLEGFDLLTPIGYPQGITKGSLASQGDLEPLFTWDMQNPHRYWLQISNSHPLLGDRLNILNRYAQFWQIDTQLNLNQQPLSTSNSDRKQILMQAAPYLGLPGGLVIAGGIWVLGIVFSIFDIWQLEWLAGDKSILWGCIPIGCSLGIFLRSHHFFPDIKPSDITKNPNLRDLYCNPHSIPIHKQPICIEGQLIGRSGISNIMGQHLILQTPTGLVPLHYVPQWTPLANFWPKSTHPQDLIGNWVKVTGWWRRGATPWIDVERLENPKTRLHIYGGHPLWSTILAFAFALWGASIISSGRI